MKIFGENNVPSKGIRKYKTLEAAKNNVIFKTICCVIDHIFLHKRIVNAVWFLLAFSCSINLFEITTD